MLLYIGLIVILIVIIILLTVAFRPPAPEAPPMEDIPEGTFPFPIFIINLDRKPERYEYISKQLNDMGLTGYTRISATDGFKVDHKEMIDLGISPKLIQNGKGLAGCASSHVRTWKHIAENKLGWSLILEDDAHFHPQFMELFSKYWKHVPNNAKIIFPGYCAPDHVEKSPKLVIDNGVMCLQGYMLSWEGAQYLLDKLLPMELPVDIEIVEHFRRRSGSYIFNGNVTVDGIRPNNYKESNGRRCMFNGIIYQNHEEQGSTIHKEETVF